jgi:hypothetical protein
MGRIAPQRFSGGTEYSKNGDASVTLRAADAVRVRFVKVVEMQARAIPHIHAVIRLDPTSTGPDTA